MKKMKLLMIVALCATTLCGCEPATEKEVLRYAKNEFGKCKLVETNIVSEDEIDYILQDKQYGFTYHVTSEVDDINIDGSKFGESESKSDDFSASYYAYITNNIKETLHGYAKQNNITILTSESKFDYYYDGYKLANVICQADMSKEALQSICENIYDLYKEYDSRRFFEPVMIDVSDTKGNDMGVFRSNIGAYMTNEEDETYYYYDLATQKDPYVKYLRQDKKSFRETDISYTSVMHVLGQPEITEDSIVTYYYFESDGKEWYMVDVPVTETQTFYSNYEEVIK